MDISQISNLGTSGISRLISMQEQSTQSKPMEDLGETFSDILKNLSKMEQTSDDMMQQLAAGEDVDLAQLMIATEQTDVSFKVAMSIRDKLVDAYQTIMRMNV
jgi:flagellar hook-basal body complex protein FliE